MTDADSQSSIENSVEVCDGWETYVVSFAQGTVNCERDDEYILSYVNGVLFSTIVEYRILVGDIDESELEEEKGMSKYPTAGVVDGFNDSHPRYEIDMDGCIHVSE